MLRRRLARVLLVASLYVLVVIAYPALPIAQIGREDRGDEFLVAVLAFLLVLFWFAGSYPALKIVEDPGDHRLFAVKPRARRGDRSKRNGTAGHVSTRDAGGETERSK